MGIIGVLALSFGFTNVFAKERYIVSDSDVIKVLSAEEQNTFEDGTIDNKNITTVITAEKQNKVENSSAESGIFPLENEAGFFF